MRKWDDLVEYLQDKNLITKNSCKDEIKADNTKKCNTLLWVLAIVGAVAAIAAIAYAVYRYMTPDYLDDFDDDFDDDFEDDFFDDEEDSEEKESAKESEYTTVK